MAIAHMILIPTGHTGKKIVRRGDLPATSSTFSMSVSTNVFSSFLEEMAKNDMIWPKIISSLKENGQKRYDLAQNYEIQT
jgi:hypothetical protein